MDLVPVVSYERASADKAKDEHTVADQRKVNRRTAERLGWQIVRSFTDNDKSAAKDGVVRDEFEQMLRVLRAGKLPDGTPVRGCVVVAEDRLVRRAGDYERFIDAITVVDGRVFADARDTKDLYSENVESMGLMGAVISHMEVKKMRRRVTQWHRKRAEEGTIPNGYRPFGWKDDKRTLDPAQSDAIRQAVRQLIAGRSLNSIVMDWQRQGFVTTRGNAWTPQTLKQLLRNPRLCGWRRIKGEILKDANGAAVVGQWEAVITSQEWEAVQAIFDARRGKQVGEHGVVGDLPHDFREHRYLLTSILRCGRPREDGTLCMAKLRVAQHPDFDHHVYQCRSKSYGGCGRLARRGDKVDEYITEAVLAKLEERTVTAPEVGPWAGASDLKEAEEQLGELRQHWHMKKISNPLFFAEAERLEAEIARLTTERERHSVAVQRSQADITDVRRRWFSETDDDRLDMSQKRAYVREAFHAIIVHPVGQGNGSRSTFDHSKLEPIWRA
ncbi:recombinase family protein [Streptosporangium sp. 'caverna']|uniref:recombinase family protein n=1 Tax=Streptosporangium sp. 'caverna' TaxID=2202249 RepID=UPI000D7E9DDE|nr:recombinase family protein [Streptosporangium sp. 'caverna']AWS42566.1 recombinase family protein [Streptosporangium sp. 'caverna']